MLYAFAIKSIKSIVVHYCVYKWTRMCIYRDGFLIVCSLNGKHVHGFIGSHINWWIHWKFRCNILMATKMKAISQHHLKQDYKYWSSENGQNGHYIYMHHCIQMLETLIFWPVGFTTCAVSMYILNNIDNDHHNT